ncbi:MAG: hypothetical protein V3U75_10760 [Methylococcaceae bacterium]
MTIRFILLSMTIFLLAACSQPKKQEDVWQSSTLAASTITQVKSAKLHYQQCISKKVQQEQATLTDSRIATDRILKLCENTLGEIRQAFRQENVPDHISDRYLKRTRTQTARNVLQYMMFENAKQQSIEN